MNFQPADSELLATVMKLDKENSQLRSSCRAMNEEVSMSFLEEEQAVAAKDVDWFNRIVEDYKEVMIGEKVSAQYAKSRDAMKKHSTNADEMYLVWKQTMERVSEAMDAAYHDLNDKMQDIQERSENAPLETVEELDQGDGINTFDTYSECFAHPAVKADARPNICCLCHLIFRDDEKLKIHKCNGHRYEQCKLCKNHHILKGDFPTHYCPANPLSPKPTDAPDLDEESIQQVMYHANSPRRFAIRELRYCNGDVVDTVMRLTCYAF